jgi:hypothetical protein
MTNEKSKNIPVTFGNEIQLKVWRMEELSMKNKN